MKKLRKISLLFVFLFVISILSACGNSQQDTSNNASTSNESPSEASNEEENSTTETESNESAAGAGTKITFVSGKPEIQTLLEDTFKLFKDETGIEVELVAGQANQSPYQTVTVMYNAGNAPSCFMVEQGDILKLKDNLVDLSDQKFTEDALEAALAAATEDGKLYAAPFITESVGLVYNKKVIENAIGEPFDPNTIKTIDDLEALFEKIEASGVSAVAVSPENWSLGAHFMMYMYANQYPNSEKNKEFVESLKDGTADLVNNEVYNGWLDTFDLLKKYNINKNDPLAANNDKNAALITEGQVAFWFMGNFIWPVMQELDANPEDFGLMPIPVSNDPSDENNTQLLTLFSMYLCVDKEQNTPEQQEASKKLIEWFLYSDTGQNEMVNKLSMVPAYKHFTIETKEPLSASLINYIKADQTLNFNILYPSDHWQVLGGSMQKYLADEADRAVLAEEIESYWQNVE